MGQSVDPIEWSEGILPDQDPVQRRLRCGRYVRGLAQCGDHESRSESFDSYVREGSVRRLGLALRVNAQLISTENGPHV
jgi:hypothetical protein